MNSEYIGAAIERMTKHLSDKGYKAAGKIAIKNVHGAPELAMPTKAGRVVRDERTHVPLQAHADGTLSGSFDVKEDGIYRIDLSYAGATATGQPSASPAAAVPPTFM